MKAICELHKLWRTESALSYPEASVAWVSATSGGQLFIEAPVTAWDVPALLLHVWVLRVTSENRA